MRTTANIAITLALGFGTALGTVTSALAETTSENTDYQLQTAYEHQAKGKPVSFRNEERIHHQRMARADSGYSSYAAAPGYRDWGMGGGRAGYHNNGGGRASSYTP